MNEISLEINISGMPIKLTLDEAKDLYNKLDKLFKDKETNTLPTVSYTPQWPYRDIIWTNAKTANNYTVGTMLL